MKVSKPILLACTFTTTALLTFLNNHTITNSSPKTSNESPTDEITPNDYLTTYEDYNQLKLFFHQTFGGTQTFSNDKQEIIYHLTHTDNQEFSDTTRLSYKGKVIHPTLTSESHSFEVHYQITGESIIESIIQNTPLLPTRPTNTLFSIIPNKVVLKTPLKTETKWDEFFIHDGIKHRATSTISNTWLDENDRRTYQIETLVPTVVDSENQPYFETRIYTEGIGLIFFKNNELEYRLTTS